MKLLMPVVPILGFGILASSLSAQRGPVYKRSAADTLRYRETTRGSIEVTTPQGTIPIASTHDAVIALTFGGRDSADAWYEALSVSMRTPQGQRAPETNEALRQPFVLDFPADGHVRTLATPVFPASFEGVTDLTKEFFDFFLPLPHETLRPGVTWTDTVQLKDSIPGKTFHARRIGRYRVTGDTVLDGERVVVIAAKIADYMTGTEPGPSPGITIRSMNEGEETGRFFFSIQLGRLIRRERTGALKGKLEYIGGPQPIAFEERFTYESRIEALMPAK